LREIRSRVDYRLELFDRSIARRLDRGMHDQGPAESHVDNAARP
jgi:hypothetical protein